MILFRAKFQFLLMRIFKIRKKKKTKVHHITTIGFIIDYNQLLVSWKNFHFDILNSCFENILVHMYIVKKSFKSIVL